MKITTIDNCKEIEWEPSDVEGLNHDERYQMLMMTAESNALYYTNMHKHQWASDDDTDYINSCSELMLAVNSFWYDENSESLIDWLNIWISVLYDDDDEIPTNNLDLANYIVNHIAS